MIRTQNLTKRFNHFLAVDSVTIEVGAGEVLAFLGPNGAGKTTTVRLLTSVLRPTSGTAQVAGYDVLKQPELVRANVGVLTELHGLYDRMPAGEYLDFFGQIYGITPELRKERIDDLLSRFGLHLDAHRRIGEYSKGMRQKLALARALIHRPAVLLLDEPSSAMDPESALMVRKAINELRSAERAIIICTHNLAEAEELADQIAIIRKGRIIVSGTPAELKRKLLGAAEFEVQLGIPHQSGSLILPDFVMPVNTSNLLLRYRTEQPAEHNPLILRWLLDQGIPVVGLSEVPRSLEQVYLHAVNSYDQADDYAGRS